MIEQAMATLYVVATPLGNLEDFSARGVSTLRTVDMVVCEDTRRTQQLLAHFQLKKRCLSYHQHSPKTREREILALLATGASVALVVDAGTPGLSDPGSQLVKRVMQAGYTVVPIPGPSAITTLLSVAGMPADQFYFAGFVPTKDVLRRNFFQTLAHRSDTAVFFDVPHRVLQTLSLLEEMFPERLLCMGRELTKIHEEIRSGTPRALRSHLETEKVRGEFAFVLAAPKGGMLVEAGDVRAFAVGDSPGHMPQDQLLAFIQFLIEKKLSRKDVVQALKILFPRQRKEFYRLTHQAKSG